MAADPTKPYFGIPASTTHHQGPLGATQALVRVPVHGSGSGTLREPPDEDIATRLSRSFDRLEAHADVPRQAPKAVDGGVGVAQAGDDRPSRGSARDEADRTLDEVGLAVRDERVVDEGMAERIHATTMRATLKKPTRDGAIDGSGFAQGASGATTR